MKEHFTGATYELSQDTFQNVINQLESNQRALEVAIGALKAIRDTKITGADIYSGAESMEFDAFDALEKIKKILEGDENEE